VRQATFGRTGATVPVIGQGTSHLDEAASRAEVERVLRLGLDLGLSHVDTAEIYGDGRVEEWVGSALEGRRDEAFLVSKVWRDSASRDGTVRACEASLRRLRTDRLDLYLLHRPGGHPFEETLAGFEALVESGKIRAFGVSNFLPAQLRAALAVAGPGRIACDQVAYHLRSRWAEGRLLPLCLANDVALVAYSPLGRGDFPAPESPQGRVLAEVAHESGVSPHAVALAFLTRSSGVFAIPRTSREEHLRENARGDVALSPGQAARLDRAFRRRIGLRTRLGAAWDRLVPLRPAAGSGGPASP
jgi:diketogulonate reductase-like aldo/keto reductase